MAVTPFSRRAGHPFRLILWKKLNEAISVAGINEFALCPLSRLGSEPALKFRMFSGQRFDGRGFKPHRAAVLADPLGLLLEPAKVARRKQGA